MIRILFLFLPFLAASISSFGQHRCATEIKNNELQIKGKPFHDHHQFDQWLLQKLKEKESQLSGMRLFGQQEELLQVPIVVHIVHNGEPIGVGSNIPDQQIFSQIEVINEDFRRRNVDAINTPEIFLPVAADVEIEFVLAKRDPNGLPTNGIVRVFSAQTSWHFSNDETELKSLSYWPAEDYINVWVVNQLSGNFIAYSTYPVSDLPGITSPNYDRLKDGIVIGRRYFGTIDRGDFDLDNSYNKGRSLTHELGHYFGLRHIWGDGGCDMDDFCDDTPLAANSYSNCPSEPASSCSSVDMFQNYMDYTPDRCMNLFTECQKFRMRTVMDNSPRRESLLTSLGGIPPEEFDIDLAITKIINPGVVLCGPFLVPEIEVINLGKITIDRFLLAYEISGEIKDTIEFANVGMQTGQILNISFDQVTLRNLQYRISFSILEVNNGIDVNHTNNIKTATFLVNQNTDFIPMVERFQGHTDLALSVWSTLNLDNLKTWELKQAANGSSNNIAVIINSFSYELIGQSNWLISPALDFSSTDEASMRFRYAYGYRENRNDKLTIAASVDCGHSFPFILFEKSGRSLSSITSNREWSPQNAGDWINEYLDLTWFVGEKDIRIAFIWTNGNGNNFFLDDIEFYDNANNDLIVDNLNDFMFFPNPTFADHVNVALRLFERQDVEFRIIDAMGREIQTYRFKNAVNQTLELPLPQLKTGVYILWVKGKSINKARRLLVR